MARRAVSRAPTAAPPPPPPPPPDPASYASIPTTTSTTDHLEDQEAKVRLPEIASSSWASQKSPIFSGFTKFIILGH
jgi:hypothetical protein